MKVIFRSMLVLLLAAFCFAAEKADTLYIISNPESAATAVTMAEAKRIFLGKQASLAGKPIVPIVFPADSEATQALNKYVVMKSDADLVNYWIAEKLKGGASQPQKVETAADFAKVAALYKEKMISYTVGPVDPKMYKVLLEVDLSASIK